MESDSPDNNPPANQIHGFDFIDRISELPESLVTQILSYLPTKESVKTSVLATRWRNHWLNVPELDLNYSDFRDEDVFISFIDRFLEFNPELHLRKCKVISNNVEIDGFNERIGTAISRGIQHVDVESSIYYPKSNRYLCPFIDFMPLNLYTSKTLVSLKLSRSGLRDCSFVSLPCLKLLHLRKIQWGVTMTLEKLVSGCPVIEELTLVRDVSSDIEDRHYKSVVRSRSLKKFCVTPLYERFKTSTRKYKLEVDAPGLEYMSLQKHHFDRYVVKNLACLCTIHLDIKFVFINFESDKNKFRDFLSGISNVRHMAISRRTLEVLELYSKVGLIPKFNNLFRLEAVVPSSWLQFLPTFLESCPNLKHLIWKVGRKEEVDFFEFINVPHCFVSSLECVEIRGMFGWEEKYLKIASYVLENSAVLKKLILSFVDHTYPRRVTDSDIYDKLSQLTKCSPGCQIIIEYER